MTLPAGVHRPTWAEIDLGRIRANAACLKARLAPGVRLMAVVKADGYGHGAVPAAGAALLGGADWLGVAILEEARELRRAGIRAPILILGWTPAERAPDVVAAGVEQTVFRVEDAIALSAAAVAAGTRARVHVKIDTGMSRLGFPSGREAVDAICRIAVLPGIELTGAFTHFARSEEPDPQPTRDQLARFVRDVQDCSARGVQVPLRHAANTAAVLRFPETHLDLVRAGIGLYGHYPAAGLPAVGIRPALTWRTRVSLVKRIDAGAGVSYNHTYVAPRAERVGVLPVGYADGYLRALSGRAEVLVRGRRAPVRGRVCMDQTVVSLAGIPDVEEGDEVVLLGSQGDEHVSAEALAAWAGTVNYEVLCAIGPRVPRCYTGS